MNDEAQSSEECEKCESLEKKHFSQPVESPKYESLKPERLLITDKETHENWEQEISEIISYFDGLDMTIDSIKLNPHTKIIDIKKFIDSHLAVVIYNNGNRTFSPYLHRLRELKQLLTLNLN